MRERFTIFGGAGFIGAHLAVRLAAAGAEVRRPARDAWPSDGLGHAIYCVGLTADFRSRPVATMEAHVSGLAEILRRGGFDSLLYLSSTRVYAGEATGEEDAPITVDPGDPSDLYNLSKLAGEALCRAVDRPNVRIARLSNVFGAPAPGGGPGMQAQTFLAALIDEALARGRITLRSPPEAAKDHVSVEDAAAALIEIARRGAEPVYNVAAGRSTTAGAIVEALARLTGAEVVLDPGAGEIPRFPDVATDRLAALLAADGPWRPRSVIDALPELVAARRSSAPQTAGVHR